MSTYTVIWSGRGSLTADEGWRQRHGSYLTTAANKDGLKRTDLLSVREMAGKTELDGPQIRTLHERSSTPAGRAFREAQKVDAGRHRT